MKFELIGTSGWKGALWGLRMPMCITIDEAKNKSDSTFYADGTPQIFGADDLRIARNRIKADDIEGKTGQPESKFLRMIHCQISITAPLYWWAEADTYKVGTVRNSASKMHRIANTPITVDSFEMDDFADVVGEAPFYSNKSFWENQLIPYLENLRLTYMKTKNKDYWKELIRLLPESYLQTAVFDCNYQTLRNMVSWRSDHKLSEWSKSFIEFAETLPFARELLF